MAALSECLFHPTSCLPPVPLEVFALVAFSSLTLFIVSFLCTHIGDWDEGASLKGRVSAPLRQPAVVDS